MEVHSVKKLHLWIPLLLVLAALTGGLLYQQQFASVGEIRYERTIESIDLSGSPVKDLTQLKAFHNLKKIDLRGTGLRCEEYEQVKSWFPEAEILWDIPLQGEFFDMDTKELTVTALTAEDIPVLNYFTKLEAVSGEECEDYETMDLLRQQRPDLKVSYKVPLGDKWYSYDTKGLIASGEQVEELFEIIPYLPELANLKLKEPMAPADRVLALREAYPQVSICWSIDLAGMQVEDSVEQLDLTGIPLTVEQIEEVLPYLPNLTFVDMTDCGISNEEMDALNRRHENIKIVWTVDIGPYFRLRTDATYFMPSKEGIHINDEIIYNLRYCTDMVAIDLGHKEITNIDFVAYMPHLKYLLLCETLITDLTPLTGLKELVFLELFLTYPEDLSPLVTLTALEDLNLHYVRGDTNIIAQMTWLKNLWWGYNAQAGAQWGQQQQMLREAIPGCNFNFTSFSSTGEGWRELPNYYAQRDIFGMYYMTG